MDGPADRRRRPGRRAHAAGETAPLVGALLAATFLVGAGIAVWHAGAEWKFWPGPQACASTGAGASAAGLAALMHGAKVAAPHCDEAAWRFLGLSMAGWNALISLKLAAWSAVWAVWRAGRDPIMTQTRPLPARPGPGAPAARLAEILRVDQAGELGAVQIYRGQRAVFARAKGRARIADQLQTMQAQEAAHLAAFDQLLNERKVRPTLMTPLWRLAGFALGAGTALIGETAAHACTEAVESVIEQHYADQIAEVAETEPDLAAELTRFRDDELAHRDLAVAEGARQAPAYPLLAALIRAGCRAAIRISEAI